MQTDKRIKQTSNPMTHLLRPLCSFISDLYFPPESREYPPTPPIAPTSSEQRAAFALIHRSKLDPQIDRLIWSVGPVNATIPAQSTLFANVRGARDPPSRSYGHF